MAGTVSLFTAEPVTIVESQVLESMPHDLVRCMTGSMLLGMPAASPVLRATLLGANVFLMQPKPDVEGALQMVRHGLSVAINEEGIVCAPDTVVLQAAFWLLSGEVQAGELVRRVASDQGGCCA